MRILLAAGADARRRQRRGHTALFAVRSAEAVDVLVASGVDVHAVDEFGYDALREHLMTLGDDESGDAAVVAVCRALIAAGAPLVGPDVGDRATRLYDAAFAENLGAVEFLLAAGHPIDADRATTALHAICWHWDYGDERDERTRAIVGRLLQAGIPADARAETGNTPLHEAMSGDGTNLVAAEELLKAGADINAVNHEGLTPLLLHYETLFDYARVVPFLLERGANPLIPDKHGRTVLDAARRMIAGENPWWRQELAAAEGGLPCGWKEPAVPGDAEHEALAQLEAAAAKFRRAAARR
jgi:hypothetical protein